MKIRMSREFYEEMLKTVFPIQRTDLSPSPKLDLLKDYDLGHAIPGTQCMRWLCQEPRWFHPDKGEIVLCKEHGLEVAAGLRRAPPLRTRIDYQSYGRKTFLVTDLPENTPKA